MKINISSIPETGLDIALNKDSSILTSVLESFDKNALALNIDIHLEKLENTISADLKTDALLPLLCSRCLDPVLYPINESVRFYFRSDEDDNKDEKEAEDLSLEEGEGSEYGFCENGEIDIEAIVQEQMWLSIPNKPLCVESCKGICQRCGSDLNNEPCVCSDLAKDSPFAVLEKLKK